MKKSLVVWLMLLAVLFGGGATYVVMNKQLITTRVELGKSLNDVRDQLFKTQRQSAEEIAATKNALSQLQSQMNIQATARQKAEADLKKRVADIYGADYPAQRGEVLKLTYPAGGEVLCLNKEAQIKWEGSPKIPVVNIRLIDPKEGGKYLSIDSVPFNHGGAEGGETGSYIWKVGKLPQDPYTMDQEVVMPGNAYRIQIDGTYSVSNLEGIVVHDYNEALISIANCQ